MDFLAQADVWSARVQEMRRNGEDLYVQENSLVSSDSPAFDLDADRVFCL